MICNLLVPKEACFKRYKLSVTLSLLLRKLPGYQCVSFVLKLILACKMIFTLGFNNQTEKKA